MPFLNFSLLVILIDKSEKLISTFFNCSYITFLYSDTQSLDIVSLN